MKIPFLSNLKAKTNIKPRRTRVRKVVVTPNEARIKRNQDYKKRISGHPIRRSFGKK